ncbi:response regulator [Betaproteobacteria bacterium PRO7]|jgi:signal transduction histidine kinase/CheY-like chemotaxis protein|nr:ATP-binding protein [Burkholderiaceae bacterium]MDL1861732.1 response regulator [Betaproteobacteria bacterium PRO7]
MARRPIATRYAALVAALLAVALIASGALETWVSHRDRQAALEVLQREKAQAAAAAVSRFVEDVLRNLEWATLSVPGAGGELDGRRLEFLKLLRLEPAITTVTLADASGREQLRVSRIRTDRIASGVDLSAEPGYAAARGGRTHFGDVFFVAQSEPYVTVAMPSAARDGTVVLADVNLKFVREVVSGIKVGETGYAYVVDAHGRLVSHPELSLVLQMTDLSALPQVQAASASPLQAQGFVGHGRDPSGAPVLAAYAKIAPLNWTVFVEQSRAEAIAPLIESIGRSAAILLVALALAVTVGVIAARRMVAPMEALRRGAQRFGAGDLAHRIAVASGDELQELAAQFNAMAAQLSGIYAELEQRVAARTRDLDQRNREVTEALEQQTATAEILRAISASPTDATPVFDTIVRNAARLCKANTVFVMLHQDGLLTLAARTGCTPEFAAYLASGIPVDRRTTSGRAALAKRPVQILDFLHEPGVLVMDAHRAEEVRTILAVPMLRDDTVLGVIVIWRREVRAFTDEQIRLLETFAAQAVIAIENIRLFERIQETSRRLDLANQAKSRLLAAASHDLRQPMHALALFVGQLRASRTAGERVALTQRIEQAVASLSELLDQLLDLSKLEAGAVQASQQDFALRDVLAAIETQFAPQAAAKRIELRLRATGAWLRSDPVLVQRILLNLVANAIRYTERGGVLIGCRQRGDRLRVEVWDTGCGIPEERRDDVFREFVRLDPGDHRRASGLGLGLAIVARLAELLGAKIELSSRVGRGSVFAFELPLGTVAARAQPAAARTAQLHGLFALVIDDDESARTGTRGLLERWGCVTLAAPSADAAIEQLAAHDRPPELIVCDYRLAGDADGLDAIARIRAAAGEHVPAILVTADTSPATLRAAQAHGVPVLHKPVSPLKLRALIAQLVAARASEQAA